MRKVTFYLALIASLNLFAVQKTCAETASYQVVITSDGHETLFPADFSEEAILFYIDWYEYWLEVKDWYDRQPRAYPC